MLWTLVIVLVLAGFALLAYSLGALDRAGAIASFLLGLLIALTGGLAWIFLMAAFTGLGILATRIGFEDKSSRRVAEAGVGGPGERGRANVLANGGAAALAALALLVDVVPREAAALAFATAVAAVTADTLASELGALQRRARLVVPPFAAAPAGRNGAVSLVGQLAALTGAAVIAVLAVPLLELAWSRAWIPLLGGFLGCQLDSLLGATLEQDERHPGPLSKQDVNFIASAVPAFVVLVWVTLA